MRREVSWLCVELKENMTMFRTLSIVALACVVAFSFMGCAQLSIAKKLNDQKLTATADEPLAHINHSRWGLYVLPFIPLLTGDISEDGSGVCKFLAKGDPITLAPCVDFITAQSKKLGAAKTVDLGSSVTSKWIPFFPFIFWWKNVSVSANAIK